MTLERALLSTEKRKDRESQIVFGIIKVDQYEAIVHKIASEHQKQRLNLELQRMLLDYVEQLEGHLTTINGQEFIFVTTRGAFERMTRGYKHMPIHEEGLQKLKLTLSIGVGFGFSANQAGENARIALNQSADAGGNQCYIVREDQHVIGPVKSGRHLIIL